MRIHRRLLDPQSRCVLVPAAVQAALAALVGAIFLTSLAAAGPVRATSPLSPEPKENLRTVTLSTEQPDALPRIRVSDNKRFLVAEDGKPFFYLADTAWELFHRLNREQAVQYLQTKADQKFTVIQAVALAELNGLNDPNPYGKLPLTDRDPARPAVSPGANPQGQQEYNYWDHVDFIVNEAGKRGLRIALLPTWASWVVDEKVRVFTPENARAYGEFLGRRYKNKPIIWVMGGDRDASGFENVWREMASGIAKGVSGRDDYNALLMTFHPRGGGTSSTWFHNDEWLDFNMHQTGHSPAAQTRSWDKITADYERTPVKPVLDGEPLYEDHPIGFGASVQNGFSFDAHVRQRAYWAVFAGACGHTYGDHSVWQMYAPGRQPINGPLFFWNEAIHRPGAAQMQHLRALIESRPVLSRVPDQSLVTDALDGSQRVQATRGDGYVFVYSAEGRPFTVNLGKISGTRLMAHWYSPRNGAAFPIDNAQPMENKGTHEFKPPSIGFGSDWVLVLDDEARRFPPPGAVPGAAQRSGG
jgi:hypothetical protein